MNKTLRKTTQRQVDFSRAIAVFRRNIGESNNKKKSTLARHEPIIF